MEVEVALLSTTEIRADSTPCSNDKASATLLAWGPCWTTMLCRHATAKGPSRMVVEEAASEDDEEEDGLPAKSEEEDVSRSDSNPPNARRSHRFWKTLMRTMVSSWEVASAVAMRVRASAVDWRDPEEPSQSSFIVSTALVIVAILFFKKR